MTWMLTTRMTRTQPVQQVEQGAVISSGASAGISLLEESCPGDIAQDSAGEAKRQPWQVTRQRRPAAVEWISSPGQRPLDWPWHTESCSRESVFEEILIVHCSEDQPRLRMRRDSSDEVWMNCSWHDDDATEVAGDDDGEQLNANEPSKSMISSRVCDVSKAVWSVIWVWLSTVVAVETWRRAPFLAAKLEWKLAVVDSNDLAWESFSATFFDNDRKGSSRRRDSKKRRATLQTNRFRTEHRSKAIGAEFPMLDDDGDYRCNCSTLARARQRLKIPTNRSYRGCTSDHMWTVWAVEFAEEFARAVYGELVWHSIIADQEKRSHLKQSCGLVGLRFLSRRRGGSLKSDTAEAE